MITNWKSVAGIILRTLILLLVIETVFYITRPNRKAGEGFLINLNALHKKTLDPLWGFDQVDPLLGYSKSEKQLKAEGLKVEPCCPVISMYNDTAKQVTILITGGSTSDLSLYPGNWPVPLFKILKAHGINAKLYVAGVGGYNSGQELLKLIRDGLDVGPVIHISYSGANEALGPAYVCGYEQDFFENEFSQNSKPCLLPNTVLSMRHLFHLDHEEVTLLGYKETPSAKFWERNMGAMHGIATENNYRFIGFLQPVLASGISNQKVEGHDEAIAAHRKVYPALREVAARHPDFLVDLSRMFDNTPGNVFLDDCHLRDEYQHVVAERIFDAMMQKKLFDK